MLQIWNLANNNLLSDASIKDLLTKEWTYNWNINSYKAYGNIIVDTYGSKRYSQANQLSIAWNEAYTSKLELDQLVTISNTLNSIKSDSSSIDSRLADLNKILGIDSITNDNSIFNVMQTGFFNQVLYFEALKSALAQSNLHQSNIDNAINGSGQTYDPYDDSAIKDYQLAESELNTSYDSSFSSLSARFTDKNRLDYFDLSKSFSFWSVKFNDLIVAPNTGSLITGFICFALVLGLIIFILGKRG